MKKILKLLALSVLTFVICFSSIACSSYSKLEKTIKNLGYEKARATDIVKEEENDAAVNVKIHVFKKGLIAKVWIVEFNDIEDIKTFVLESDTAQMWIENINEDGTDKEYYNKLVDAGYANGNCLVIPLSIDVNECVEVKNAVKKA